MSLLSRPLKFAALPHLLLCLHRGFPPAHRRLPFPVSQAPVVPLEWKDAAKHWQQTTRSSEWRSGSRGCRSAQLFLALVPSWCGREKLPLTSDCARVGVCLTFQCRTTALFEVQQQSMSDHECARNKATMSRLMQVRRCTDASLFLSFGSTPRLLPFTLDPSAGWRLAPSCARVCASPRAGVWQSVPVLDSHFSPASASFFTQRAALSHIPSHYHALCNCRYTHQYVPYPNILLRCCALNCVLRPLRLCRIDLKSWC